MCVCVCVCVTLYVDGVCLKPTSEVLNFRLSSPRPYKVSSSLADSALTR